MVGLTVSFFNSAAASMAIHSTVAPRVGVAPELVAAPWAGQALPDDRLQGLHGFTLTLLRQKGSVDKRTLEALQAAGYTTEQSFEVIAQVAYTSVANWVATLCDPPLDEPFQPLYWSSAHPDAWEGRAPS